MSHNGYDILVIGSGMGGMCAAALLSRAGYRTLVVEALPRIGGRCSTIDYKGFKLITGVIGVEMGGSVESFFEVYPDGRLISIVRDPKNWYPSALRHEPVRYGDIRNALGLWHASTQAMMWNKEKFGERFCIIKFEDLVSKTEPVMRHLAYFLGIQFDEILLTPTFNKSPIRANTSFELEEAGLLQSALTRYKTLKEEELEIINEMTKEEYQKVLDNVVKL